MDRWSSRFGFLLAAIGAAVGLGNIWRFSAVVGQNGGGAYLIPYLVAAFAFAVPLMILEISVGRHLRVDVVAAFASVGRRFAVLGWIVAGSVLLILSYYLVLTGWVLAFLVTALGGDTPSFAAFTSSYQPVVYFLLATLVTGAIVSRGVRGGIERMSKIAMPAVFLILVALALYATQLPGFGAGVRFLFTPDFSVLTNPLIWSAAFGQVFFSLSVGQGIMLTYGSYLDDATDVTRSSLLITLADIGVALLAGIVIFPVVFTFGLAPTLGTELAFSTLPRAFSAIPFGGVVAVAFFGLLVFAAISSSVSLLEVGVASLVRTTQRSRSRATWLLTGLIGLVGLPSALSYSALGLTLSGVRVLDLLDESVGTLALPVTAILIAVVFTWFQDPDELSEELGLGVVIPVVKYAVPAVLLTVMAIRLGTSFRIPAWGLVVGAPLLGRLPAGGITLLLLLGLAAIGILLVRFVPTRIRRRIGRRS